MLGLQGNAQRFPSNGPRPGGAGSGAGLAAAIGPSGAPWWRPAAPGTNPCGASRVCCALSRGRWARRHWPPAGWARQGCAGPRSAHARQCRGWATRPASPGAGMAHAHHAGTGLPRRFRWCRGARHRSPPVREDVAIEGAIRVAVICGLPMPMRRGLGRVPAHQPVTRAACHGHDGAIAQGHAMGTRWHFQRCVHLQRRVCHGRCSRQQADEVTALHIPCGSQTRRCACARAVRSLGWQPGAGSQPSGASQQSQGLPAVQKRAVEGSVAIGIRKPMLTCSAGATSDSAKTSVPPGLARPAGWRLCHAPQRVAPAPWMRPLSARLL